MTRVEERYSFSLSFWSIIISSIKEEDLKDCLCYLSAWYIGIRILLDGAEISWEANSCLASLWITLPPAPSNQFNIYENQIFITVIVTAPHCQSLSWGEWIQVKPFFYLNYNIIFTSMSMSSKLFSLLGGQPNHNVHFPAPHTCCEPCRSICHDFMT